MRGTTSEQHSIARPFGIHDQNLRVDDKRPQLQQATYGDSKGESGDTRRRRGGVSFMRAVSTAADDRVDLL